MLFTRAFWGAWALGTLILPSWAYEGPALRINWIECERQVPSTLQLDKKQLHRLPSTLHCGQIKVPMDYDKPFGWNNTIALGLAMYRPPNPKGVIFVNPGGSDAAAVLAWQAALNLTSKFDSIKDYDLMMIDVRGTYSSNPVNVSLDAVGNMPTQYPTNASEFETLRQHSKAFFQSWIRNSSPPGIIQFLGTNQVIQDYEQVRRALGYQRIHFLGQSYGSYRAQAYAKAFPNKVGNFVLDAVVPQGLSFSSMAKYHIKALGRAVRRADAYCQNDATCPFRETGIGSVPMVIRDLISQSRMSEDSSGNNSSSVSTADLQQALLQLFEGIPNFPMIIDALYEASHGNLTSLTSGQTLTVESVVSLPLECGDSPYNEATYEDFKSSYQEALTYDNTSIAMAPTWTLQLYCSGWPFPVKQKLERGSIQRMLLVTSDFDLDAPTEWTTFARNQYNMASLIERHGDGHTSFGYNSDLSDLVADYFHTGQLPPYEDNMNLSVYSADEPHRTIPNPYAVPFNGEDTQ